MIFWKIWMFAGFLWSFAYKMLYNLMHYVKTYSSIIMSVLFCSMTIYIINNRDDQLASYIANVQLYVHYVLSGYN